MPIKRLRLVEWGYFLKSIYGGKRGRWERKKKEEEREAIFTQENIV